MAMLQAVSTKEILTDAKLEFFFSFWWGEIKNSFLQAFEFFFFLISKI